MDKFTNHQSPITNHQSPICWLLIALLVLGSISVSIAVEPLYYYDKYNVKEVCKHETRGDPYLYDIAFQILYREGGENEYTTTYYRNRSGGIYEGACRGFDCKNYLRQSPETFIKNNRGAMLIILGLHDDYREDTSDFIVLGHTYEVQEVELLCSKVKGSMVSSKIKGTTNQYPSNGVHTDGYWYIKKGLVNTNPTLTINSPTKVQIANKDGKITISGTVKDPDNDKVTISATIGGKAKSTTVTSTSSSKPWTLTWSGSELGENKYSSIKVTADDGNGGTDSKTYTGAITVDKTPPTTPTLKSSNTNKTNKNVNVTITYSADSSIKEYKIGSGAWTKYTGPVTISSNSTIYARATDAVGNVSAQGSLVIGNINKTLPVITINPYTTTPTNKDVVVTAKTNKGTLNKTSHTFTSNGSFEFIATDDWGNITKETIEITNINKVKPVITVEDYEKGFTNKNITVKVKADKGILNKTSYTFTENGTFTFIVTDEWGNVTKETVTIDKIDKIPPKMNIIIK